MAAFTEERNAKEVHKQSETYVSSDTCRTFSFLFLRVTDQRARLLHCKKSSDFIKSRLLHRFKLCV